MTIHKGDIFRHVLAGGGGWGDPLERDPQRGACATCATSFCRRERARPTTAWSSTPKTWTRRYRGDGDAARRHPQRARLDRGAEGAAARSRTAESRRPSRPMALTYRVGVDIGGTFTDIVVARLGRHRSTPRRSSSSVGDYARAIVDGLERTVCRDRPFRRGDRGNPPRHHCRLERDPRAQGRARRPDHHEGLSRRARDPHARGCRVSTTSTWTKPPPLVERYLRKVVDERIDHQGNVERALDPADAERAVDALLAEKVEAIAVCLMNSFTNPGARGDAEGGDRAQGPSPAPGLSFEVLPEIKEYERTSTTTINAYVMPIVATYLRALRKGLDAAGIPARLLLMQSNGGLTTDVAAAERPMNIVESGPAGGVVGAQALARVKDLDKIITFDMGGTTAKASMVEHGEVSARPGIRGRRGHHDRLAAAHRRRLHAARCRLSTLPRSAQAGARMCGSTAAARCRPGLRAPAPRPARSATTRGATEPTITDANVLLGYINPAHLRRRRAQAQRRQGKAFGVRREGRHAAQDADRARRPTVPIRSWPPT